MKNKLYYVKYKILLGDDTLTDDKYIICIISSKNKKDIIDIINGTLLYDDHVDEATIKIEKLCGTNKDCGIIKYLED